MHEHVQSVLMSGVSATQPVITKGQPPANARVTKSEVYALMSFRGRAELRGLVKQSISRAKIRPGLGKIP